MTSSRILVLAAVAAVLAGPALAGSSNTLYLLQDSTSRPDLGNNFLSDQTAASGSLIGTSLTPAMQKGALNDARLTIVGNGGTIQLYQDNSSTVQPVGNTATVTVSNGGTAGVIQSGNGNDALINVRGFTAGALVTQLGDENLADVDVRGTLAGGTVVQNGDNNVASLDVRGFSVVTYIQNGSNLSTASIPVTVWSNAGPVVITQTSP